MQFCFRVKAGVSSAPRSTDPLRDRTTSGLFANHAERWETELILEGTELDSYIKSNGRWLFHAIAEDSLEAVEDLGIKPGGEVGRSSERDGFWRPRSGRIYLSTLAARVNLGQLDPAQIGADEEVVPRAWHAGERWVDTSPPLDERARADGTLADWAETTPGFDSSEVTSKSLWAGSVSYTGAVPAAAVQAADRRGFRRR